MVRTTLTAARQNLASLMDRVVDERDVVVITRRNRPSVALIALDELRSLRETVYLIQSPRNAARLVQAHNAAVRGGGRKVDLEEWGRKLGIAGKPR